MKINNYLPIAITALAINSGGFAFADFTELLEHKVTYTLTNTVEGDVKDVANGYTQKFEKEKISNKQILEFLAEPEQDVIDDIKGWSIVLLSEGYEEDDFTFYLVHKNEDPIDVTDYFYLDEGGSYIDIESETVKEKNDVETTKGSYEFQDSETDFGFYYYDGEDYVVDIFLEGAATFKYEYLEIDPIGIAPPTTDIYDLTTITAEGHGDLEEFSDTAGLVSGSVKVAKGTESDIVFE